MRVAQGADETRDGAYNENETSQTGPTAVADLRGGHDQGDQCELQCESEGGLLDHPGHDRVHFAGDDERRRQIQQLGGGERHDEAGRPAHGRRGSDSSTCHTART